VNQIAVEDMVAMHVDKYPAGPGLEHLHELGRADPAVRSEAGRRCSLGASRLLEIVEELLEYFATGWILEWRVDAGRPVRWTS
jgi:hypothetical protein